ncbi:exosortase C-terminal domain/associated protein EpsI [Desulfosarcina cetonica]|uniref:exosortase C-terminal domain/associated protein EpsI n=1 Tax=Desulfosarcina cetonica TaxID=90730 RepID=UPI00248D2B1C|nr:exosortase C-terminal domain/associated protein EpsI [Desulfosarcina cetonica]
MRTVGRWSAVNDVAMEQHIVESLNLDDYLFRSYSEGERVVTLYIGYYYTADKVGAAHSPLVCFPGQGWEISTPKAASVTTAGSRVSAEQIMIRKGQQRELILYWFQAYDRTSPGTLKQKLNNFWAKLRSKPEDNAFVRVSVTIQGNHVEDAAKSAETFIQAFYPAFFDYVTNQQSS